MVYIYGKSAGDGFFSKFPPERNQIIRILAPMMWLYGRHAVKSALLNEKRKVLRFVLLESCRDFLDGGWKPPMKPEFTDKNFFSSAFGKDAIHQGCAVLVKKLEAPRLEELLEDESDQRPFMFLDRVTDPQNVGGILRAAAVFGARAVVTPDRHSPELTPVVAKAASGAAEVVPLIRVVNLVQSINDLRRRNFWCVGLDERADKTIQEISLKGKFIFIIGGEGRGMRRLSRESCDFLARLPSFGNFSTLNAAQAATVTLYEFLRQNPRDG
jgi:23S rRNA (guanosine2251-2'-O)-methyltransferase